MKLISYFDSFEFISDECVKKAIETFGKDEVCGFISNIAICEDKNLQQKMMDYSFCNSLANELQNIEKELYGLIRKPSTKDNESLDATGAYLKEISKYPVLSLEEEKKYCQYLELGKEINVLKKYLINGKEMYFLDLGKIFVSLYNNEYAPLILDCLKSFHYPKETMCNVYINYYLQLYDKLVNEIGYYPNCNELESYFNKYDKYKLLKFEDSYDKITLLEEIKKYMKYSSAKEIMINCNLRLVVSIAKKYANNVDIIDLVNEGNLGLIEAVSRFDVKLGYRFSTYAFYWVRQHISRYVYNQSSCIKITENFKYQLTCFKKALCELEQKYKRTLSIDEIATNLKMPVSKVINYLSFSYTTISLDDIAFNDDGGITFGNLLYDEDNDVEKLSFQNILKYDIEKLLSNLNPRELLIIKLRFGFDEIKNRPHTFQEISDILGITCERIRQIEKKALTKLKKLSTKSKYSHLNEY